MSLLLSNLQVELSKPRLKKALDNLGFIAVFEEDNKVSRPREPPPQSLSELYVNLSAHTAPIIQSEIQDQASSAQKDWAPAFGSFPTMILPFDDVP